jgi:hypothetical protein
MKRKKLMTKEANDISQVETTIGNEGKLVKKDILMCHDLIC